MNKLKRTAIVLSLVLAAMTGFTACGGSGDTSSASDSAAATTTTAAAAEESKAEETKAEEEKDEPAAEETAAETTEAGEEEAAPAAEEGQPAKKAKSVVAEQQEAAPEAPAEQTAPDSVLAEAFANTIWCGMDSNYNVYALLLSDQDILFMSDDGSSIEGYWGVIDGDPNIYIFSDPELTDCIAAMPFYPDTENNLLIINDTIVLTPTEASDAGEMADVMQQTANSCKIASFLDGTYWAAYDENDGSAAAMSLQGEVFEYYQINSDGEEMAAQCYWNIDTNGLNVFFKDEEGNIYPAFTMGISIPEDGSYMEASVEGENGVESLTFYQVSEEYANNIVEYLHSLASGEAAAEAEAEAE